MNGNLICILVILAVVILTPVVIKLYRAWDFKRQITGKIPFRTLKESDKVPGETPKMNPELESMVMQAKMDTLTNTKKNLFGNH